MFTLEGQSCKYGPSYSAFGKKKNVCLPLETDDKHQLGLVRDIERALLLAQAGEANLLTLRIAIFFHVGLGAFENNGTLLLVGLFMSYR